MFTLVCAFEDDDENEHEDDLSAACAQDLRAMQALAEESSGSAGRFPCFLKRVIFKQVVSIHTLNNRLKNRRKTSVFELSSPQYRHRCEYRVIFAG
jgi:hypothetical protein